MITLSDASSFPLTFQNQILLSEALTHTSYAHEQTILNDSIQIRDNERLEFLGDAVVDLALSELLFQYFPSADEGDLSRLRSYLVSEAALAGKARILNFGQFLKLGKGEDLMGGRDRDSTLSCVFEAVVGALFREQGWNACLQFLHQTFQSDLENNDLLLLAKKSDSKSELQELTQGQFQQTPSYRLIEETGPAHSRTFKVSVALGARVLAEGCGTSKKESEQKAAQAALEVLKEST